MDRFAAEVNEPPGKIELAAENHGLDGRIEAKRIIVRGLWREKGLIHAVSLCWKEFKSASFPWLFGARGKGQRE